MAMSTLYSDFLRVLEQNYSKTHNVSDCIVSEQFDFASTCRNLESVGIKSFGTLFYLLYRILV